MLVECEVCEGTSECPECHGTGLGGTDEGDEVDCDACDGTGTCQECGGSGEYEE